MTAATHRPTPAPRVLVVDADCCLNELLDEWLGALGCQVVPAASGTRSPGIDLVIVDVPFPRHGGVDLIRRVSAAHPGAPIVAISSAFFAGIDAHGAVARLLGVACALPKPASREALTAAVLDLLPRLK